MGTVGLLYWIPEKTECPNGSHPCVPREPRALQLNSEMVDLYQFLKHPKKSLVGTVAGIITHMTIFFLRLFIRWRKKGTALILSLCLLM